MTLFSPNTTKVVQLSATSVAASIDAAYSSIRIYNLGPNKCFVRWGTVSQTAVATDMCIAPDSIEAFNKGSANSFAGVCSANETALLNITLGHGE